MWGNMALAFIVLAMVFVMLYLASCTGSTCVAHGVCNDSIDNAYYCVDYFNSDEVDSVEVENGEFTLKSVSDTIGFCVVATEDGHTWQYFTEPGNVTLHDNGDISGTPLNDDFNELRHKVNNINSDDEASLANCFSEYISRHKDDLFGVVVVLCASDYMETCQCAPLLELLPEEQQNKVFLIRPKDSFYR